MPKRKHGGAYFTVRYTDTNGKTSDVGHAPTASQILLDIVTNQEKYPAHLGVGRVTEITQK